MLSVRCRSLLLPLALLLTACSTTSPPTITPSAEDVADAGARTIEITVVPPPGATRVGRGPSPIEIDELVAYRDAEGRFSIDLPAGWSEARQSLSPGGDAKLGTLFQPPGGGALLSITQFDNGQPPASVGASANQVLELTGVIDQPGYTELAREQVPERPGDALRLMLAYTRRDGLRMRSLVLFQVDGTVFSMVHLGVEEASWQRLEGVIRDVVATYRVPAVP